MNNNEKEPEYNFSVDKFNDYFDKFKENINIKRNIQDTKKLEILNNDSKIQHVPLYEQSLREILFKLKITWFDIFDEMNTHGIFLSILTKNNRLFYLGISLILFSLLFYMLHSLFENEQNTDINTTKIIEKHYIYTNNNV